MSSHAQRAGSQYDNDIAGEINAATDDRYFAHSMRGSGNTRDPSADVLVRTPSVDAMIELKTVSMKGASTAGDKAYVADDEDLEQLGACRNELTETWFGVSFAKRQLLFVPYETPQSLVRAIPECFDPHTTDGGRLRLTKPDTSAWPSASSGASDVEVILDELGLVTE